MDPLEQLRSSRKGLPTGDTPGNPTPFLNPAILGKASSVSDLSSEGITLTLQKAISLAGIDVPVNGKRCEATDQAILVVYNSAVDDIENDNSKAIQRHLDKLAEWAEHASLIPGVTVDGHELEDLIKAAKELLG